jgi:protein TonB
VRRYAPAGRLRMFEESTLQQGRRRRSLWPLAVSAALHAGAIAALGFAAARTPALGAGERPIDVVFLREAIQDEAAPPAAAASPEERRAARERQAMLDRLVQPTAVPDDAASGTAGAAPLAGAPKPGTATAGAAGVAAGTGAQDGSASGDADLPVDAGGRVVGPVPIESSQVQPVYPEEARRAGVQGLVVLEVSIDEQGKVGDVKVVRGLGHGCDEAMVAAVRQWRFHPATRDGKPIKVRHVLQLLSLPS